MKLSRYMFGFTTGCLWVAVILGAFAASARPQSKVPESAVSPAIGPVQKNVEENDFRVETVPVPGGAEIVTIFARQNKAEKSDELPLVSVLRDTLGDNKTENDRLRYMWMLSYTEPSLRQKAAAFVPFFYTRTVNKKKVGTGPPPPLADLQPSDRAAWQKVTWVVFKKLFLGGFGIGPRASALQYRQNTIDYRRSAVARALAVLSLYESAEGEKVLSERELEDIQARLVLTDATFGWHMQGKNLQRIYEKERAKSLDVRNQNWELLRQYSEAQGLYFDPLEMPDGSARHALVWAAAEDIASKKNRKYDPRFLNIKDPWADQRLVKWKGYSEVRWFDTEGREVDAGTPEVMSKTMLPLALYGLDNPKIPTLLIDFRDNGNPKRREMSRRILHDVTSNVLSLSPFSSAPYLLGRFVYDFVTGKRGMDLNQASRLRSYSQLKLLLSLDESLNDEFCADVAKRVESATLNPLENDLDVEAKIARKQYENLMAFAKRPDGLPAKLDRMRREEMVKLLHSPKERGLYSAAHVLTFGLYTHREKSTPELLAQMDTRRQLEFHERRLAEIARTSVKPEVDSDVAALRQSLAFISENGSAAKDKTVRALARVFAISDETDLRELCLAGLYRINNTHAKTELLAIYRDQKTDQRWRGLSAHYLKLAISEGQRISSGSAAAIGAIGTN